MRSNEANGGQHFETRDTVVVATAGSSSGAVSGNGAVCVQPVVVSSRKNSASALANSNPFVDPSKRHSSVDMKGMYIFKKKGIKSLTQQTDMPVKK